VKAKAIAVICVVGRREWVRLDATRARELWELLQSSSGEGLSEKRGNINIKHSRYGSGVVGGSVEHVQLLALRMVGGSRGIRPSWELMQVLEGEGPAAVACLEIDTTACAFMCMPASELNESYGLLRTVPICLIGAGRDTHHCSPR